MLGPETEDDSFRQAFWASLFLIIAATCGHAAIYVCDQGRTRIIEIEHVRTRSVDVDTLLRRLPESVSKTIHQTSTPHGTTFQVLMLLAALLILSSEFPKHEFVQKSLSIRSMGFEVCRCLCPVVGILMLIFVPMSHDFIVMTDRFKQPGYKVTREDKVIFYANKMQEDMHTAAGALAFAVTPALEGMHSRPTSSYLGLSKHSQPVLKLAAVLTRFVVKECGIDDRICAHKQQHGMVTSDK